MNILIVEDDAGVRSFASKTFHDLLRGTESNILEAENIHAGLNQIRTQSIDIVLLDLNLPPDSPVRETLKHIPEFASKASVVIMTGFADGEIQNRVRALGALAFVPKDTNLFSSKFALAISVVRSIKSWNSHNIQLVRNLDTLEALIAHKTKINV